MFGTIGHVHLKSGSREPLDAWMQEWRQSIRQTLAEHVEGEARREVVTMELIPF